MKPFIALIIISLLLLFACKNKQLANNNNPTPSTSKSNSIDTKQSNNSSFSPAIVNPTAPGETELSVIIKAYPETSIETLNIGHQLYYKGACIECHKPKDIKKFELTEWKNIIDKMAVKAKISDEEKDAVYKYVLSVRASN